MIRIGGKFKQSEGEIIEVTCTKCYFSFVLEDDEGQVVCPNCNTRFAITNYAFQKETKT